MIIVSQDKKVILNFNNIVSLEIGEHIANMDGEREATIEVFNASSNPSILAYYETEERAKEVLQEIISKYKTTLYNSKTNETVVNIPKVYEMPEK